MGILEKKMVAAVNAGKNFKLGNTEVKNVNGKIFVLLHGNLIYCEIDGKKYYSDAGWSTKTTGSRLRALGAEYSTNSKKNKCFLTSDSKMHGFYIDAVFNLTA